MPRGSAFDDPSVIAPPGRTRIYSNAGFDILAALRRGPRRAPVPVAAARVGAGPAGHDRDAAGGSRRRRASSGPPADLAAFAFELLRPTLLPAATLAEATTVAFPGLRGVLPGVGRFDPLDWGLGFELRDAKTPHWTGTRTRRGRSGTSGRAGRSCGWTRTPGWRWRACPSGRSGPGRSKRGRPCPTRCSPPRASASRRGAGWWIAA